MTGLIEFNIGGGLGAAVIVKVKELLVPPPGVGENTVTAAVPTVAIFIAGIIAVNWDALIYVVERDAPFHLITEPLTKLLPFTVNVKDDPPTIAEAGVIEIVVGTGLLTTAGFFFLQENILKDAAAIKSKTEYFISKKCAVKL